MTHPPRNPRCAYDAEGRAIPLMSLGTMREHGVRSVLAICQEASCGHAASINLNDLPDSERTYNESSCSCRFARGQPDHAFGCIRPDLACPEPRTSSSSAHRARTTGHDFSYTEPIRSHSSSSSSSADAPDDRRRPHR
jgi:hypothetical protein